MMAISFLNHRDAFPLRSSTVSFRDVFASPCAFAMLKKLKSKRVVVKFLLMGCAEG